MTARIPNPWSSNNSVPADVEQAIKSIQTSRRRHVIKIMDDAESPKSAVDLAEMIAATELDKTIQELDSHERKRVYIALYQTHLDKLDEAGAIAYRERSKEVYATEAIAAFANLVRHIESVCETEVTNE